MPWLGENRTSSALGSPKEDNVQIVGSHSTATLSDRTSSALGYPREDNICVSGGSV